jgi:hypothetical protein
VKIKLGLATKILVEKILRFRGVHLLVVAVPFGLLGCGSDDALDLSSSTTSPTSAAVVTTVLSSTSTTTPPTTAAAVEDTWSQTYKPEELRLEVISPGMGAEAREALRFGLEATTEYLVLAWKRLLVDTDHKNILPEWTPLLHPYAPYDLHVVGPTRIDWESHSDDSITGQDIWFDDARVALWMGTKAQEGRSWIDAAEGANLTINAVTAAVYDRNTEFGPGVVRRKSDNEIVAVWIPWAVEVNYSFINYKDIPLNVAVGMIGTADYRRTPDGGWAMWGPRPTGNNALVGGNPMTMIRVLSTRDPINVPMYVRPETGEYLFCGPLKDPKPLIGETC